MKDEFALELEWIGYELRPEMPPEGMALASRFSPGQIKQMYENLRRAGAPLGLVFGEVTWTSNSHLALAAGEYARDHGIHDPFHERVFRAYFTETLNIGRREVVLRLAEDVGLDSGDLAVALEEGRYTKRLEDARMEGMRLGVTAVPTFFLNESLRIVGAQPIGYFQARISEIQAGP